MIQVARRLDERALSVDEMPLVGIGHKIGHKGPDGDWRSFAVAKKASKYAGFHGAASGI